MPSFVKIAKGIGPLGADLYKKIHVLTIFRGLKSIFLKPRWWTWREGADLGPPTYTRFVPLGQFFYQKFDIFAI